MKKLLTVTILITAMFCFNSCRNAHSVNGAEITETIDTSDCGRLVQYIDLGRAGTQFSIRKEFSIHSKLKLPIKLDVYRNVLFDNKYVNWINHLVRNCADTLRSAEVNLKKKWL